MSCTSEQLDEEQLLLAQGHFDNSLEWLTGWTSVSPLKEAYKERCAGRSIFENFKEAVGFLCLFYRDNFCGPVQNDLGAVNGSLVCDANAMEICKSHLNLDYETPVVQANNLLYLLVAKWSLVDNGAPYKSAMRTYPVWLLRTVRAWQWLFATAQNALAKLLLAELGPLDQFVTAIETFSDHSQASTLLELAGALCCFYRFEEASKAIEHAFAKLKFTCSLTGALGRRTKFQTFDCAQLVLQTGRSDVGDGERGESVDERQSYAPSSVTLKDDTLLDQPVLLSTCESTSLSALEQCAIVASVRYMKQGAASMRLKKEEMTAYLRRVIDQRTAWSIQTAALFLRSQLEMDDRRRVERALEQVEEQIQAFHDGNVPTEQRWRYLFASGLEPIWTRTKCAASILSSLGCLSSALKMFTSLKQWSDVIACYKRMNQPQQAERLIRDLCVEDCSPTLLCHLGDVTDDPEEYAKAWQLSNGTYAPAQRRLGNYHIRWRKYDKAKEALELALALQPLDLDGWFNLGFCNLKLARYGEAIGAYQRVLMIEPDYAEAWSNLALAAARLGDHRRAYQVLRDAVRCSYESVKIWQNFATVSCAAMEFKCTLTAVHRLLDMGCKVQDFDMVCQMVTAFVENKEGVRKRLPDTFKVDLRQLLARLTAKFPEQICLWRAYATLYKQEEADEEGSFNFSELEKYVELCEKAHRSAMQNRRWQEEAADTADMICWCKNLLTAYLMMAQHFGDNQAKRKVYVDLVRTTGSGALMRLDQVRDSLNDQCSKLSAELKEIVDSAEG